MFRVMQFRCGGCFSYVAHDEQTKEAIVVDPIEEIFTSIGQAIRSNSLKLKYIIDTHTHADHPSSSLALKEALGGQIALSHHTESRRVDIRLRDQQVLELGTLQLNILEVPGHTRDHIAIATEGHVFTGDTLHVGTTARADFPGSSVKDLYACITEKLFNLTDDTVVYPGHGYNDYLFTAIGIEKKSNRELVGHDLHSFVALKNSQQFSAGAESIESIIDFNKQSSMAFLGRPVEPIACSALCLGDTKHSPSDEVSAATAWELANLEHTQIIDVREQSELSQGIFPNSVCIPLSTLPAELWNFQKSKKYFFACRSGARSRKAQKTLSLFGIIGTNISGGILAWKEAGLPTDTATSADCIDSVP